MLRIVMAEPDEVLSAWLMAAISPVQAFEVVGTALDGESALAVVRRTDPDVVVVDADVMMPPQGCVTLVEAIRKEMPATLVFVLAEAAREETARAVMAAGATAVLAKDGSAQIPADLSWADTGQSEGALSPAAETEIPPAVHETAHAAGA